MKRRVEFVLTILAMLCLAPVAAKETVSGHKGGFIFGSLVEGCDAGQGGGGIARRR